MVWFWQLTSLTSSSLCCSAVSSQGATASFCRPSKSVRKRIHSCQCAFASHSVWSQAQFEALANHSDLQHHQGDAMREERREKEMECLHPKFGVKFGTRADSSFNFNSNMNSSLPHLLVHQIVQNTIKSVLWYESYSSCAHQHLLSQCQVFFWPQVYVWESGNSEIERRWGNNGWSKMALSALYRL